jgi:hypothetical protein
MESESGKRYYHLHLLLFELHVDHILKHNNIFHMQVIRSIEKEYM